MKRILNSLIFIGLSLSSFGQISQNEANVIVNNYIKNEKISDDYWLYAYNKSMTKSLEIKLVSNEIKSPDFETWTYFLDEIPFANWSHDCRYIFINKENGKLTVRKEKLPPSDMNEWSIITELPKIPKGKKFDFNTTMKSTLKSGLTPSNCYAVIISGGIDHTRNWERYWNDCSAIYSTLVNVYDYLDDHIYVLISDGTDPADDMQLNDFTFQSSPLDLDGDGDNDIQFSATSANITNVFNTISGILDSDDYLFIFSTDHGGQDSGDDVFLCLWGENMDDNDFATEVNKVNAGDISIVMEQCHSGGFISDLSDEGRVIATACTADENSWAMPPDYTYNEFVLHWTSAVAGQDPDGNPIDADSDNDGFVSMLEAFEYAEAEDTRTGETPQYNSTKDYLGANLTLLGYELCTTENVHNETINSDVTIENCNVDIDNVTIQNNANVVIDADNGVTIQKDFEVKVGSILEIK